MHCPPNNETEYMALGAGTYRVLFGRDVCRFMRSLPLCDEDQGAVKPTHDRTRNTDSNVRQLDVLRQHLRGLETRDNKRFDDPRTVLV